MAIIFIGALRFAGLAADVGSLPLDANLLGAIFDATDTLQKWVFNGVGWNEFVAGNPLTTKGDLFGFSTTDDRFPVGVNQQVLEADSSQDLGLKYVDLLTTKGNLLAFSTVRTELSVGTDGFVLTADSAEATGLKWAAGGGGGLDPTFDTVTLNLTTPAPSDPTNQSIEWFETLDANNDVKHIKMKIDGAIKNVRYF